MTEPQGDVEGLSLGVAAATGTPLKVERGELDVLIRALADARNEHEEASDHEKALRLIAEGHETALFDAMERLNIRAVRHERGLFTLNDLAWAKIEDRAAALAWAEANEPELLTLNNQRLSVVVREHLKGERAELPAGVAFSTTRKITWRRK